MLWLLWLIWLIWLFWQIWLIWLHYTETPYASAQMFLDDVVALATKYPDDMQKHTGKRVKVINSLVHATSALALEYLFNNTRFIARNPHIEIMYGTTRNEAFHLELKSFFRNIRGVRARRAQLIGEVVTVAKLLVSSHVKSRMTKKRSQSAHLHDLAMQFFASPGNLMINGPRMDVRATYNVKVNVDELPTNAKRMRKCLGRPAARSDSVGRPNNAKRMRKCLERSV